VAALSALKGAFCDPLKENLGIDYPVVGEVENYLVDDSMLIFPPKDGSKVEIVRGPNIGEPPKSSPLQDSIEGLCTLKVGDNITTDHIMPAGARLKYRSNIAAYAHYTFEGVDPTFHDRAKEIEGRGLANIVVAGLSYGQGSSREHAAICPMYLGVKVVLAQSFERIHQANLCNFGILPLEFLNEQDYQLIEAGDSLKLENLHSAIEGGKVTLINVTKGVAIETKATLSRRQVEILKAGGLLNLTKATLA
jgi:aconitate hydratase